MEYLINSLKNKEIKFLWTPRCEETFQQLNRLLTSTLILKIVAPNGDFVVCTISFQEEIGGILMQNGHIVVCYE